MLDIVIMIVFLILGIVHHDQQFFYIAGIFALASSIILAGEKIADAIKGDGDITVVHPEQLSLFDDDGKEFKIPEDILDEINEHSKKITDEIVERMKQGKEPGENRSDRC